ncbi:hypothetical protein EKN06_01680 [Croceicoccus ponticola]|uniref:DUF481 domain-containing protein n=1 Tax=Croceicoccus ponticola TaxID=2217664 RepID=A0A437H038_9SPHN|nr:hypothetical protein [Croceicoccus ponticola]RVQ68954.1 hypothetical protein EKN06_01680 [Croceicoccus ponticola]
MNLRPAAGVEVWASTDTEGNDVLKVLGRALWNFEGKEKYAGLAIEHAWFSPSNGDNREEDRVYLDVADRLGTDWRWEARLGTNGDTLLGNAELRRADWSRTFFLERDIVETNQGLTQKIYYTFAGASMDIPIDPANTLAVTAGVQAFSGKNERLHLRGHFSHVIKAEAGISTRLDVRYYHSTEPGEFDYFSPRDFIRLLPLVQVRRFDNAGWMYLAAGGVGAQHSTGGNWQSARYVQLRLESPQSSQKLDVFSEIAYSNDSISAGPNYDYLMGRAGVTFRF